MNRLLALLLLAMAPAAQAQFTASGDMTITGQTGVGTSVPQARMEVKLSSADAYALRVSSQDGSALLVVDRAGRMGVKVGSPAALLDVNGQGDASDIGLQLRSGNSSATATSSQIVFAYGSSGTYRHSLRTRAAEGQNPGNAIDFYLWHSTGQPEALGDLRTLSLEASPSASTTAVHVRPVGGPLYELVVSDGETTGAGTVVAASIDPHVSHRAFKSDISYLDEGARRQAYEDVLSLRHARFRYKKLTPRGWEPNPGAPLRRGLIYEDAPASIRGEKGKSLAVDRRLANMEMALAEANRRIKELEDKIALAEKGGGR